MRICLVSQEYPPETAHGGIGTQTWNKAHALAARGHEVHVLSRSRQGGADLRTDLDVDRVTVHRMQPPGSDFVVFEEPTYWLGHTWSILRHLVRLHAREPFDLVDFAEYGAEGFAYQLDRTPWNWIPVVVQLHGPIAMFSEFIGWPEADSDLYRLGSMMEGLSIERADGLMACSAAIADFAAGQYTVPRDEIDVVHCGVDADTFGPVEHRSDDPPTILFVGNIALSKGLGTVLDAALQLRDRHPGLRLRVAGGGDSGLEDELRARAEASGAGAMLDLVGFVSDRNQVADLYRGADVFCSPALHEVGVANVYIEAMACACPVVAASTGGAPEAVEHERTGLLVPPGSVGETTAALDRILASPELRAAYGQAARERVDTYFRMEHYIERVLATYERAVERSRRRLAERQAELDATDLSMPLVPSA